MLSKTLLIGLLFGVLCSPSQALLEWLSPEDWVHSTPSPAATTISTNPNTAQSNVHFYTEKKEPPSNPIAGAVKDASGKATEAIEGLKETVKDRAAGAKETLQDAARQVVDHAEPLRGVLEGSVDRLRGAVSDAGQRAGRIKEKIKGVGRSFRDRRHYAWPYNFPHNYYPFLHWPSEEDGSENEDEEHHLDQSVLSEPPLSIWKSYPEAYFLFTNVPGIPAPHLNLSLQGDGHLVVEGSHSACLLDHLSGSTESSVVTVGENRTSSDRICVDRYLHTRHQVPPDVNRDKVSAFVRDGVLIVRLEREAPSAKVIRKVPVHEGGSPGVLASWGHSVLEHLGMNSKEREEY